jgi:NADH-quinone oxidoreductase subunit E
MACCCNGQDVFEEELKQLNIDVTLLDPTIDKYGNDNGNLIKILQKAQEIYGFLPKGLLKHIATRTGVKDAKVYGVATFYTQFRLKPIGKNLIMLCQGTACHVNGSEFIGNAICEELGIEEGETTPDNLFTFQKVACLGCCSLAPVMMINDETYAKLTPDKAKEILREIQRKESEEETVCE